MFEKSRADCSFNADIFMACTDTRNIRVNRKKSCLKVQTDVCAVGTFVILVSQLISNSSDFGLTACSLI